MESLRYCLGQMTVKVSDATGVVKSITRPLETSVIDRVVALSNCVPPAGYADGMSVRIHRNFGCYRSRRLLWNMYATDKRRNAAI